MISSRPDTWLNPIFIDPKSAFTFFAGVSFNIAFAVEAKYPKEESKMSQQQQQQKQQNGKKHVKISFLFIVKTSFDLSVN